MKILSIVNFVLSLVVLITAFSLISTSKKVQGLQEESREMLVQIQQNSQVRQVTGQVATNIVKDMAQLAVNNQNLLQLLNKHGFNVQVRQNNNAK